MMNNVLTPIIAILAITILTISIVVLVKVNKCHSIRDNYTSSPTENCINLTPTKGFQDCGLEFTGSDKGNYNLYTMPNTKTDLCNVDIKKPIILSNINLQGDFLPVCFPAMLENSLSIGLTSRSENCEQGSSLFFCTDKTFSAKFSKILNDLKNNVPYYLNYTKK